MTTGKIHLTECPRDAMQGLSHFVPTTLKAEYINLLLQVGFDTIDFGSFVSPKAIPQMRDTNEVLKLLDLSASRSRLLAIVANYRGAEDAAACEEISILGFPFSISETFQQRNTNAGIGEALETVKRVQELCMRKGKHLLTYLSMGFGNPYGDRWDEELVCQWAEKIAGEGVSDISLADTVGVATAEQVQKVYAALAAHLPSCRLGLHLHSTPGNWRPKIEAAINSGCRHFDAAIGGFGGCPMAADQLTGNIATENLIACLDDRHIPTDLNRNKFEQARRFATRVFSPVA